MRLNSAVSTSLYVLHLRYHYDTTLGKRDNHDSDCDFSNPRNHRLPRLFQLCHSKKTYRGSTGIVPPFLNVDTRRR